MKQKIVLVTGSSRGIGASIAKKFSHDGSIIIVHHYRDDSNAKKVLKKIQKYNKKSIVYSCDVRNYVEVKKMAKFINKTFGAIDVLVNNAGITKDHSLKNMDINYEWDDVIYTNLYGIMHCCKALLPLITKNTGKIINISSIVGNLGNYGQCAYSASKAGVIGFTRSLAKECANSGISVNAVLPGFIDTNMVQKLPDSRKKKIRSNIPFKRFGKPEEVASMIFFLSSNECTYVTGQTFVVDGGLSINPI